MQDLMTLEEVARYLKVTKRTVRTMIERDGLPAFKMGPRQWRVVREELEAWLSTLKRGK